MDTVQVWRENGGPGRVIEKTAETEQESKLELDDAEDQEQGTIYYLRSKEKDWNGGFGPSD